MTKQKSKIKEKGKKQRKYQTGKCRSNYLSDMPSWVDKIEFKPVQNEGVLGNASDALSISVISWNILADSYNSRRSQPSLPVEYQRVVFDKMRRGSLIRKILRSGDSSKDEIAKGKTFQLMPDVWALQEVDMDEILSKHLSGMGYEGIETPRMKIGCGSGGRVDSCGVYYRKDRWTLLDQEVIRLDDLAIMPAKYQDDESKNGKIESVNNNLQGLQRGFLRRNNALLIRLQSKISPETSVVIAATHLFWNPMYEYVKLCQMHYIMVRSKEFLKNENEPFILCGDLNSLPGSTVHAYLTKGVVDAKVVAPWYQESWSDVGLGLDGVAEKISSLNLTNGSKRSEPQKQPNVRYLLDYNLNRLARWFRILGLDAGLEMEEEERLRTKEGKMVIFDRCRLEHRVLITTSNKLVARKDCPPGTYLINPRSLALNLEVVFVHILLTHGVVLEPHKFLSRCVVCNGNICTVHDPSVKIKIFTDHQAPLDMGEDLEVYQCDGCRQGYWWCDRPTSSASRVKIQATRLYQLCLRGGVPVSLPKEVHMFEHVDTEKERCHGWDWSLGGSELLKLKLQVTEWLKDSALSCPIKHLESAYKDDSRFGESLPYTNVTSSFEGTLDYLFFNKQLFTQSERLYVPTTYGELNTEDLPNGHLLPSNVWPSDHLAIGAKLVISSDREDKSASLHVKEPLAPPEMLYCAPTTSTLSVSSSTGQSTAPHELVQRMMQPHPQQRAPQHHPRRCDCGCVPAVLSLFEMAELRKKARLQREAEKAK